MKRNKQCKFTIKEEEKIVQEYEQGSGATVLGRKYGCHSTTIYNILKAYETERRTLKEARNVGRELWEGAFETIETREQAYWLGVMYSDGYISKTNQYTHYFGLAIKASDREWLEKFKAFLKTNISIKEYVNSSSYGTHPYVRLYIGCNKIVSDLERLGVVEHKTFLINQLPKILFLDDFVRGVIDGDGSIRANNQGLRVYGTNEFLVSIAEYLNYPYSITPDKSIYCLEYGLPVSRQILRRLYQNAPVYLDRKYELAKKTFHSLSIE